MALRISAGVWRQIDQRNNSGLAIGGLMRVFDVDRGAGVRRSAGGGRAVLLLQEAQGIGCVAK